MDMKYTKDGKKVVVVGKINSETWIVQEIFMSGEQEIPTGENFTVNTLLDEPMETWETRNIKKLEETKQRLEASIEKLGKKQVKVNVNSQFVRLINRALEKYEGIDVGQLSTLLEFVTGQITHVIINQYKGYEILTLEDAIGDKEDRYDRLSCNGLKLVSLFGCTKDGGRKHLEYDSDFRLDWRINQYRDGSGSWTTVYPCRSYEEAVEKLDGFIADKDAYDDLIELKEKYNLSNPSEEKIEVYKAKCIANQESNIIEAERKLQGEKNKLENMKGENNGST